VFTGNGLDQALSGAEVVVDVTSVEATDPEWLIARNFFATTTRNILAAEPRAGVRVRHHVLPSIVGLDRIEGNAHYAGKRLQEELVLSGSVPITIERATQFHEFAGMVVGWTRQGDGATVPLFVQPFAARAVGQVLAEIAASDVQGRAADLAGPEPQDLVDMARRTLSAWGESVQLIPSWRSGVFGVDAAGEMLVPGPDARLAPTTFDAWLATESRKARARSD
jgi:uncharacterized protein YbjT (DUF2867 family)